MQRRTGLGTAGEERGPTPRVDTSRAWRPGSGIKGGVDESVRWPRPG